MTINAADFEQPGDNQVTISNDLEQRLKNHFLTDRTNRFKLYILSSGIRKKYLDTQTQKYTDQFLDWYKKRYANSLGRLLTLQNMLGRRRRSLCCHYSATRKIFRAINVSAGALYESSPF